MNKDILFLTPPFTQLNTPYPATAYLKGYFNTLSILTAQADLGIEVILSLFSSKGLKKIFETAEKSSNLSMNALRMLSLKEEYLQKIDDVISFLQHKKPTLAHAICDNDFLPEAGRFDQIEDLDWSFGNLGTQNKARYLATLFLEDIGDLITEAVDPDFGFSRYAERIGRSATSFTPIEEQLNQKNSPITTLLFEKLEQLINSHQPKLIALSIPFPGNLLSAFQCAKYIKENHPTIKVSIGGGYVNTELRSITDSTPFNYIDAITLDDGEAPLRQLIQYFSSNDTSVLKRTFMCVDNTVTYFDNSDIPDVPQRLIGTPDYSGLPIKDYLSVIEVTNPMHTLWSNGRWNKLTLAHGCYWKKCTFCDISLDYIERYEPLTAQLVCDRIEELIEQTGENGFHFVDEAAPPALLRELALEIIKRKITIVWWTNIRFEKSFTYDLCRLLKASGCIAVSGGLEVASDRLLNLINKGVSVKQVANVCANFTQAGIMTHAYLMYGFPTQTEQETIDSLEMVQQMFSLGLITSAFWHQFAMTAHSPVGLNPEKFNVKKKGPEHEGFAYNDLEHIDKINHNKFSEGLQKSTYNYMNGVGFDLHLQNWFDFPIPNPTQAEDYIKQCLEQSQDKSNPKLVWLGKSPMYYPYNQKEGNMVIHNIKEDVVIPCTLEEADNIKQLVSAITNEPKIPYQNLNFIISKITTNQLDSLKENGLLFL